MNVLDQGGSVTVHGLGAAIEKAVTLCEAIVHGSGGRLKLSASTSTVTVLDDILKGMWIRTLCLRANCRLVCSWKLQKRLLRLHRFLRILNVSASTSTLSAVNGAAMQIELV